MLENIVRPMFWQVIEWNIGIENNFKVSVGKSGKFAKKFMTKSLYEDILKTYSDSDIKNNWNALETMARVFTEQQKKFAKELNLEMNTEEAKNSAEYIRKIRIE